jgi:hypothetical protein
MLKTSVVSDSGPSESASVTLVSEEPG